MGYDLHLAIASHSLNPFQASFFDLQQQTDPLQFVVSVQAANAMIHRLQEREYEARKVKDGWIDFYFVIQESCASQQVCLPSVLQNLKTYFSVPYILAVKLLLG